MTKKMVLTDRYLKALKPAPEGKRAIIWDAIVPGLGVRITDRAIEEGKDKGRAAARSFVVVKRRGGDGDLIMHTIGRFNPEAREGETGTLAHARDAARAALSEIVGGKHPDDAAAERRRAERRERRETFREAVEAFLPELKGLRSAGETEATLRRDFLGQVAKRARIARERDGKVATELATAWSDGSDPIWCDLPAASITRRDVIARLDAIKKERGKHAARHALTDVRKFFNWCAEGERFGIEASPAANVSDKTLKISGKDLKRKRVLFDDELRDVWRAATATPYPFGPLVRLLMLTGQRLNDLASARWREIDLDAATLVVPPERFKTGNAHEVPLPPRVVEIARELPRFAAGSHVFSTTSGRRPISGFSKMKERLDRAIAEAREKEGREAMPAWVLHDLRRTARTRLVSDLGKDDRGDDLSVDAFIAERVIGHALPGLHATYDQGTHRDQKRTALERWERRLLSIVEPEPNPVEPKVVPAAEVERRRKRKGRA
ncbi:MAG TPA: site-specific integrase [Stellaceae bacterium]|nr:site-specific integrase [Stellaceae bacterium]